MKMVKVTVLRDCDGEYMVEKPAQIVSEQDAQKVKEAWSEIDSELGGAGYFVKIENADELDKARAAYEWGKEAIQSYKESGREVPASVYERQIELADIIMDLI